MSTETLEKKKTLVHCFGNWFWVFKKGYEAFHEKHVGSVGKTLPISFLFMAFKNFFFILFI